VPNNLIDFIPKEGSPDSDALLGRFLEYIEGKKLELYPAQEAAILELFDEKNVILNTPTGSGKSLVAAALHFKSLAQGNRSVYTCPIKALVNEKWLSLCKEFGPENVGLSTGDATVNRGAPILCCTAEILANIALHEGELANIQDVVMDEFHYYSDRDRGVAWQIPLLTMPQTRFLLMSATLGNTEFFEKELTKLNGRPSVTVHSKDRPVPLEFAYSEDPLPQTLENLVQEEKTPAYVVHFTQLDAAQSAQDFTSINVCTKEEKAAIAKTIQDFKFTSPYGPDLKKWLRHGIGLHHAGLLPKYRILVEQLAQQGLLKVICGTDTLGVGINVPIRTVLFTRLCKYDGEKTGILSARDFHQVSGRAGRKGFDDVGWVIAQAPEHVIDNKKLAAKAERTGKKITKRKPPEHNFVNWDDKTYSRLMDALPEQLTSRFQVTHGMLLNVLSRESDGCQAMRDLIRASHDSATEKRTHFRRAWQLFKALLNQGIIEFKEADDGGSKVRVNLDLQEDFSMNQTLSLYLIETLPQLNPELPEYPLDLLTLVESIVENPDMLLRKQLDRVKDQKMAEMKADGIEYDERMEELEKLEYPKPNREFIYSSFNAFAAKHPWVGQNNVQPKSIVREMFEQFRSFADYIKDYHLQRSEGLLLRHLNNVYKVLAQTVPDAVKTDEVREMETYLITMIRQVDSSLLNEWEKMKNPEYQTVEKAEMRPPGAEEALRDITRDKKAFTALIRTRIFTLLRALANGDFEEALATLTTTDRPESEPWTVEQLSESLNAYYVDHQRIFLDPNSRNIRHTHVKPSEDNTHWIVQQVLIDPEEKNDWMLEFTVDLAQSKTSEEVAIRLNKLSEIG